MSIARQWEMILSSSFPGGPPFGAVKSTRDGHSPISPESGPTPIPSLPAHGGNFTLRSPANCNPPIASTGQENCNIGPRNSIVPPGAGDHGLSSRTKESRKRGHGALNADQALTTRSNMPESRKRPQTSKRHKRYLPSTSKAEIPEHSKYDVEFLVFHRAGSSVKTSEAEYLVCWAGNWPLDQRYTWEPEENINVTVVGGYWRRLWDIGFAEQETE